jgi:ABC-2 type transport system ATP-binding protein
VHDPTILVVDEPLVGLDPRSARIVKDLFVSQARSGCTVLMSTHLLAIAEELADRIGIVDRGRMLATGTLDQLRRQVQHHGPLEDLFLKLTGDLRSGPGAESFRRGQETRADHPRPSPTADGSLRSEPEPESNRIPS